MPLNVCIASKFESFIISLNFFHLVLILVSTGSNISTGSILRANSFKLLLVDFSTIAEF